MNRLVCVVLLFLSFRWVPGVALTLATVGMSVVATLYPEIVQVDS